MAASKAQQKAVNKYMKENYDSLRVIVPKGQKTTIQAAAEEAGESVNQFTQRALLMRMGLQDWPKLPEEKE